MIVPKTPQLRRMLQYVGLPLLLLAGFDLAVVVAYNGFHLEWVALPNIPLALYGSAIGIILGFRNNSAYSRWWEARTLWGTVVNNSRSLGRQVTTGMRANGAAEAAELKEVQRCMVYHQIAFVHALRQHLRGLEPWWELKPLLESAGCSVDEMKGLSEQKNLPLALQQRMGRMLDDCLERGWMDPMQWRAMDESLNDLVDAQGGAERIKNTPMPKQYDYFPQFFVQIYCVLLPLALVTSMGWFTPLGSTLVGFMFLALDKIGRDLEDPFDNTIYDIPMTAISKTIETNLRQMLGETELPEPEKPVAGVLW
ncbi:bestrophin family ion channel [Granulicella sp. dw_53]|uniref:bestrophin family protein n=1 Tax=Granulicella sp. dw_53 TaxID=2719792 RepID=UPI001BD61DC6